MEQPAKLAISVLLTVCVAASDGLPANTTLVFAGTRTGAAGKGIYAYRLQTSGLDVSQNITLVPLGLAVETPNPTYLELDLRRRLVFAIHEEEEGAVSSFAVTPDGKLSPISRQPSAGSKPCRLAVAAQGATLLVANCGSGTLATLSVAPDGKLGQAKLISQAPLEGLRGVAIDPAARFAFATAPVRDRTWVYRLDTFTPAAAPVIPAKPGSGPSQIAFRPDGKFAYIVNSKTSTITAFAYDAASGGLDERGAVSTVPEYYDGPNHAAEIALHPSGKYLYVSNVGHNSVVLFTVDPDSGALTYVEEQGTGGKNPMFFGIQPSAAHMTIVNHDSNTLLVSRIDSTNGRLKPSGVFAEAPSPSCVRFLPPPGAATP